MNQPLTLFEPDRTKMPVTTLADYIYPAIQKQYVTILTLEAKVLADDDIEAIHQMRVSLRRLRSQIQAFTAVLDIPKYMGDKQIGKIAKVLGKVRDLDVLQNTCKHHQSNLPDSEQIHLDKVASTIVKRRRKEILKVKLMLNDRDYQYFKLGVNNWLNNPQYLPTAQVEIKSILPELLLPTIGQLFIDPSWWIDQDSGIDPELAVSQLLLIHGDIFHNFRKQMKATRYLMEIFVDRYPAQYLDYLKDFKQVHQLFGNIQDNLVLDKFIRKALGKRAPTKLPTLYDRIARSNHLNWNNWQPIQDRYRQSTIRQEFQLFLIKELI
ncbi:CHAD domain-containing protein [Chamaesiphon sp. VAR_48_metabat_135_sub]|uniref:CHAD domain-containing protein n=1 Tax=Chamaesiphon sp. VAR_48_metabat_135_sub TaxID=2964699 RepID=UPI00286BE418|nr:CHAD domain-containing protein [Chamaesiphon sp. VAR_48_metabat_135_sub]